MNIEFKINHIGNVYHIINAISKWSPRCRPNIQEWYRVMFGISKKDEEILKLYADVRTECQQKGLNESLVPAAFLLSSDYESALQTLASGLSNDQLEKIRVCFDHFMENCTIMFNQCLPSLKQRLKELEHGKTTFHFNEMMEDLRMFFDASVEIPDLNVYLLLNTCSGCTGGYAPVEHPGNITVEPKLPGKSDPAYVASDFSIAAHEASHLVFAGNPGLKEMIFETLENEGLNKDLADYIEEAIIGTQFPFGYLSTKYGLFDTPQLLSWKNRPVPSESDNPTMFIYTVQNKLGAEIYSLAQDYIERKAPVTSGSFLVTVVKELAGILSAKN